MSKIANSQMILRNHGPMALFGLLTFIGIIFIWTAKLYALNTAIVTAIPILIMLGYLVISLIANGLRLHNEQAGDNLYYMGFLFTLSSLGVSLYRFTGDVSIDEIVRNFGIAVTSTICGIAFRILFNQMRRDPVDIERSVRHELAEMTRRVRTELDSSAREFSSYRRTSSQMLVEGFEEIAVQAERTGEAVQKAIETLSKESIKPIQDAAQTLATISEDNLALFEKRAIKATEIADAATERLDLATHRISSLIENISRSIDALSEKMAQMKLPDEVLRIELQPVLEAISIASAEQNKQSEQLVDVLSSKSEQFLESLKPIIDTPILMSKSVEPIQALPNMIEQSLRPISEISSGLKAATEALSELVTSVSSSIEQTNSGGEVSNIPSKVIADILVPEPTLSSEPIEVANVNRPSELTNPKDIIEKPILSSPSSEGQLKEPSVNGKKGWFRRW